MLRVYKDFLQRMLVLLAYAKSCGYSIRDVANYGYGRYRSDSMPAGTNLDTLNSCCYSMRRDSQGTGMETVEELIVQVSQQLAQADAQAEHSSDKDLIDTLVRMLQLPYARGGFGTKAMQQIKQALLLPEELVKLKTSISWQEKFCTCGHQFKSGEAVSVVWDSDGVYLFCTNCSTPAWIRCSRCEGSAMMSEKQQTFFTSRKECGCKDKKRAPEHEAEVLRDGGEEPILRAVPTSPPQPPTARGPIFEPYGGGGAGNRLRDAARQFAQATEARLPTNMRTLRRTETRAAGLPDPVSSRENFADYIPRLSGNPAAMPFPSAPATHAEAGDEEDR